MIELVRLLDPADVDEVRALDAAAREALRPARGGAVWLLEHPAPAAWPMPTERVWVAELDGLVVGFLRLALDGAVARVEHVYVRPECRELGFGDELLAAALEEARRSGCARLDAVALPGDRDTKNLYERAGVVARAIVLGVSLSDPASSADASR
jgi:GNAT superfamily N-acetyltransferase